jgi:C4-dicarboxylate transporter, DctM subunit
MEIMGLGPLAWGALMLGAALALLLTGIPVWIALSATALLFIFIISPENMVAIPDKLFGSLDDPTLLAIPLFVLMAESLAQSGAAKALFVTVHKWLSWLPGEFGVTNLIAPALLFEGSGPAAATAIGGIGIPEMKRHGYPPKFAGAIAAVGTTVVILLPPSITMIVYGATNNLSIGSLWIAGILPGYVLIGIQCVWVVFYYKRFIASHRHGLAAAPAAAPVVTGADAVAPSPEIITWKDRFMSLPRVLPFLAIFITILGSILMGWASPTEAAGLGALVAFIMAAAFYKALKIETLKRIFTRTVRQSSMILLILAASLLFGYALSNAYTTQTMADGLINLDIGKWGTFFVINLFILALGFFLPPVSIILLVVPIFTPVLQSLGFNLIWYGAVLMLLMQITLVLPTVGLNILTIKPMVPEATMGQLFKACIPFLINILITVLILCAWPNLALWLPGIVIR